ncbi:MAG: chromate efflux transporter [Candidatus Promineifilaceae bacterium]
MTTATQKSSLHELAALFTKFGFTAFGGPAAHIAMLHDEVVVRRGWMSEQHFLDLVGATNLIPGPNSTEMMMHTGQERAGWKGLLVAGACFILPAAMLVTILAWAYVTYGATPQGENLLYVVKPVVAVIVLQALIKLGRKAVKNWQLGLLGAAVFVLYLLGVNELVLLFGTAGLMLAIAFIRRQFFTALIAPPLAGLPAVLRAPLLALQESAPVNLGQLFLVFLKTGAVLYGSGYVLLAFLRNDLVLRLGWLTDQQLIDAVAIGQVTPGPILTTATFIGYVLAGVPGAIVATLGIFLPSFVFVSILNPLVPRMRQSELLAALLDGVNVAALGLMAGVTLILGRAAVIDVYTVLFALIAAVLVFRFKISSILLVGGAAVLGLLLSLVELPPLPLPWN